MLRIRRIDNEVLPGNKNALDQVKAILRSRFSDISPEEIARLGRHLHHPFLKRFRAILETASRIFFYGRADVLTVSIHGDPSYAYP